MEDNTPHNKWRERLNSIPPPQGKEAWSSMEVLLDEHLPVRKKSWLYVVILILLLLLVLTICNRSKSDRRITAGKDKETLKKELLPQQSTRKEPKRASSKTNNNLIDRNKENLDKENKQGNEKRGNITEKSLVNVSTRSDKTVKITVTSSMRSNNIKPLSVAKKTKQEINGSKTSKVLATNEHKVAVLKQVVSNRKDSVKAVTTDIPKDTLAKSTAKTVIAAKDSSSDKIKKEQLKQDKNKWAFGAGLNYFLRLGDQSVSGYGDWKEFLPVLQGQFYLTDKLYLQAEFQWYAPQYAKESLVYKNISVIPPTGPGTTSVRRAEESIFVKKLSYADIPLSLHISPVKNMFVGGGIQYSILRKALGLHELKISSPGRPDSIVSVTTHAIDRARMKQTFNMQESRFLFDVAAKIKRFNVGVQYNQSFRTYIKNTITGGPNPLPKNKSLHLFLRYQLSTGPRSKRD